MFWKAEVRISQQLYTHFWAIMRFLRLLGLFPLTVQRRGSTLFLKWSPWYAMYSYALGLILIFLAYHGLLDDILNNEQKSIKVIFSTDRYVLFVAITEQCLVTFCGIFVIPSSFLKFFLYIKYLNQVDAVINTTYTKRDKYVALLMIVMLVAYVGVTSYLDDILSSAVAGKKATLAAVAKKNIGLQIVATMTLIVEYTNRHMAFTLEKRFIRLNDLLEELCVHTTEMKKTTTGKSTTGSLLVVKFRPSAAEVLTDLRGAYLKLLDAAQTVNDFFGLNTLAALFSILFLLVVSPYFLISVLAGKRQGSVELVPKALLFVMHFIRLLLITEPWYACSSQIDSVKAVVCKLLSLNVTPEFRKQVQVFAMVLCLRDLKFTACGLVTVDRLLFTSMISNATTYLVIVLQAQLDEAR